MRRLHANLARRTCAQVLANPAAFDVAVTTYDMMHSADLGRALCRTIHWRYLVLDEGHKIKNEHTLVSQSMRHTRRARSLPLCFGILLCRPGEQLAGSASLPAVDLFIAGLLPMTVSRCCFGPEVAGSMRGERWQVPA